MPHLVTEGIPLRGIRYSETSQILTLLTREGGTVRAIAKGAHRKKGGPVDTLQVYRLTLITKGSGALATLCEWDCLDPLPGLRRDLNRLLAAWYKAEVAAFLAPEGAAATDVYDGVRESLADLDRGADPAMNTLLFSGRMLRLSGHQPALQHCGGCQRTVPLRGHVHYSGGTLLCHACRGEDARTYPGAAVALVGSLLEAAPRDSRTVRYPPHLVVQAQAFLDDQFREITEKDLRIVRYWKRWGSAPERRGSIR